MTTKPIVAERVDSDTLIADCPFCRCRHEFKTLGKLGVWGWWTLWSQCDHPRAFRSRNQRKYLILRVPKEESRR